MSSWHVGKGKTAIESAVGRNLWFEKQERDKEQWLHTISPDQMKTLQR